jgi:hypothetical protein
MGLSTGKVVAYEARLRTYLSRSAWPPVNWLSIRHEDFGALVRAIPALQPGNHKAARLTLVTDTSRNQAVLVTQGDTRLDVSAVSLTTYAGDYALGAGLPGDDGAATSAQLNGPFGVTVDASGNLYIADHGNKVVREIK